MRFHRLIIFFAAETMSCAVVSQLPRWTRFAHLANGSGLTSPGLSLSSAFGDKLTQAMSVGLTFLSSVLNETGQ